MANFDIKNADLNYFKPIVSTNHNLTWKWLLNSGYSVKYISLCLGIRIESLSGYFREPERFTLQHIHVIILLLKGIKEPNEVLKVLLLPMDKSDTKLNEGLKDIYNSIELPEGTKKVPVHRLDFEPKKAKESK